MKGKQMSSEKLRSRLTARLLLRRCLSGLLLRCSLHRVNETISSQPRQRLSNAITLDSGWPILQQGAHNCPGDDNDPQVSTLPAFPQTTFDTNVPRRAHGRPEEVHEDATTISQEGKRHACDSTAEEEALRGEDGARQDGSPETQSAPCGPSRDGQNGCQLDNLL
jgi:hypothetical protein